MRPHVFWLGLSLAVVAASVVLSPDPQTIALFGWELPGLCTFRRLFGIDCPGCGLTRSFVYMGHLQPRQALEMHLLGPVLYTLNLAHIPWRLARMRGGSPSELLAQKSTD